MLSCSLTLIICYDWLMCWFYTSHHILYLIVFDVLGFQTLLNLLCITLCMTIWADWGYLKIKMDWMLWNKSNQNISFFLKWIQQYLINQEYLNHMHWACCKEKINNSRGYEGHWFFFVTAIHNACQSTCCISR